MMMTAKSEKFHNERVFGDELSVPKNDTKFVWTIGMNFFYALLVTFQTIYIHVYTHLRVVDIISSLGHSPG